MLDRFLRGVPAAFLAYAAFSCSDALIKQAGILHASVFEIGFFVALFSIIPVVALRPTEERWRMMLAMKRPLLVHLRGISGISGGLLSIYAFTHLPLAEAYALIFLIPIFVTVLSVVILWSGWRYEGPRSRAIDTAIGGVSGFTGGACGLPGPPVIIYWMAARLKAAVVRANTMVFLYITDCAIGVGLFLSGILTFDGLIKGAGAMPFYLAGLLIGARGFSMANETTYRRIAFLIILVAAITSLPLFDAVLR